MEELEQKITDELIIDGCSSADQCEVYLLETSFVGYCGPSADRLPYATVTTDMQKVEELNEHRTLLKGIKSELYNVADFPWFGGYCSSSYEPKSLVCNAQNACEFVELSVNYPGAN